MSFRADVDTDGKLFEPSRRDGELRRAYKFHLLKAGLLFQGEVEQATPFGVTGKLRRGWVTEMTEDTEAVVYNSEEYALPTEQGRRPGKGIPIAPLELWAKRVLNITEPKQMRGVAFAISKKAKLHGIPGKFFARDTFQRNIPKMNAELGKMGASIVKGLE